MTAAVGDATFIANYLINTRVYAVVMELGQAQEFIATFEVQGDQGTLTMAAIIGPQGPPGIDMFVMSIQTDALDEPSELPQTLQNSPADNGKYWVFDDVDGQGNIIGSSAYIWYGTSWRRIMLGTPGPPGPVPVITPSVDLVDPTTNNSEVIPGGSPLYPTMQFELAVPPGPEGPGPAIAVAPDIDLITNPPVAGDILGFTGRYSPNLEASPPGYLIVDDSTAGGTLPAGDTFWVVTGRTATGETTPSNEVSATLTGTTSSAELTWNSVPLLTQYSIYRGTTPGGENVLVATVAAAAGGTQSYIDTGGAGSAGAPPGTNTAVVSYPLWVPVSVSQLIPSPYSMPENAFTAFSGLSQRAAIGSFALPPQPFPWTPIVWGHLGAFGLELSANPLMIGAEVRLGDPTAGQLVSRGFGNTLGEVNFMPHYSDPNNPGVAITPLNGLAVVPPNHTNPAQGTIYTNLYNDGAIGVYQFSPTDAQIFVQVVPVAPVILRTSPVVQTRRVARKVASTRGKGKVGG